MARFVLLGNEPREFHDFGLLHPGDTVEAQENPDPAWFDTAKTTKPKPTTTEEQDNG